MPPHNSLTLNCGFANLVQTKAVWGFIQQIYNFFTFNFVC